MRRIGSQLKTLIRLKYLIIEIPYIFSLYSVSILVLHTLNNLSPRFSGIKNNNVFLFSFANLFFFVFAFTTPKKKIFVFDYF